MITRHYFLNNQKTVANKDIDELIEMCYWYDELDEDSMARTFNIDATNNVILVRAIIEQERRKRKRIVK